MLGLELVKTVGGAGGVDVALDVGGFHLLCVRVDAEALQQHRPCHGEHKTHHDHDGNGGHRHTPGLERDGSAHADGRLAFERVGAHEPDAQHHAEDGGQHGHDEGDGDVGMHGGVGGTGDA